MPTCNDCRKDFEFKKPDLDFYAKINVPKPKNCPECRLIRRFNERNPKSLYYRKCDLTGETILSQFHKDQPFPVYSPKAWWSDDWDGLDYGIKFDFKRPFFDQFIELKNKVPHLALFNTQGTIENSDYNNCTAYLKNCYLIAESDYCEDCYYSNLLKKSNDVMDCSVCYKDELCYKCIDCRECNNLFYSQDCESCNNSYFLRNCIGCEECIGCINLRHKKYMIFNKQYSQEKYERIKSEYLLSTNAGVERLNKLCEEFFITQPHKYVIEEHNQHSTGDHIFNCKNAYECFDCIDLEDCRYCQKLSLSVKDSMDFNSWGNKCELIYQCSSVGDNCNNVKFCSNCQTNISDCEYCAECFSISNCFGCVGLKKQEYCILNKKYNKFEYYQLLGKILDHMATTGEYGQFFPKTHSPYGFNETMAIDVFRITKEEAIAKGYKWYEQETTPVKKQTYVVPNSINEVDENILNEILECKCGKNYKIIKKELEFYKKLFIPIPLNCPTCRHQDRMNNRRPLRLWKRNCESCLQEVKSNYSPDRGEKIFCKECYLKELY